MDKPQTEGHTATAEDFQKEYQLLCKRMGMVIVPSLVWIARDDGTWSSKVNLTVGNLPKENAW